LLTRVQDLVNVLQHLDRDADGRLSFDEFAQGISRLGINLHEGELQVCLTAENVIDEQTVQRACSMPATGRRLR
jgi:hypothetical protein